MTLEKTKATGEELSLKLFIVLSRAVQTVRKKVEDDIRSYGLNPTEFAVLELIYHKGDQPIQKIGEKVLIASSSITYVVDKLEKKQLIKRKPCPTDRRIIHASITEKGKERMDEIFPLHKEALLTIFAGLESGEKTDLIELLKKLGYYAQGLDKLRDVKAGE
ncbi:MarR family transcriptional regulator [Alkalihalobacillus oceani]|uniref:MarR family winged helix-turn-helix transcriptional regulator n=1 Tax=Halalkalibacter oceani TaxID=1653776 RepID=UPI00203B24A5|nr:MarR family transcriptional regulator [Halalkalibacter oceani]